VCVNVRVSHQYGPRCASRSESCVGLHSFLLRGVLLVVVVAHDDFNAGDVRTHLVDKYLQETECDQRDDHADKIVRKQHVDGGGLGEVVKIKDAQQDEASKEHSQLKADALEEALEVAPHDLVGLLGLLALELALAILLNHRGDNGWNQEAYQNPVSREEIESKEGWHIVIGTVDLWLYFWRQRYDSKGVQRAGLDHDAHKESNHVESVDDAASSVDNGRFGSTIRGDRNGGVDFEFGRLVEEGDFQIPLYLVLLW